MAWVDVSGRPLTNEDPPDIGRTADQLRAQYGQGASKASNPYAPYFGQGPGIAGAYKTYLGRDISGTLDPNDQGVLGEYQSWLGNPNFEEGIKNSAEAQAFRSRPSGGGGGQPSAGSYSPSGQYQPPPQSSYPGTSIFDDPATKQFEALLNQRIQQLQTPYANPDFQPAIDQLRGYLSKLNGPAYTSEQMDLMQTQALDPLERQRSQAKQQVMQRLAARGIPPSSGIVERALEDVDHQFNQLRTRTQSGFATNAVNVSRENAASAAALAPQIASLQQQNFNTQDTRNQQAVSLAQTIPNLAWSRLTGAQSGIQQTNPLAALQLLNGMNTNTYNQDASYWAALLQALAPLFGLS